MNSEEEKRIKIKLIDESENDVEFLVEVSAKSTIGEVLEVCRSQSNFASNFSVGFSGNRNQRELILPSNILLRTSENKLLSSGDRLDFVGIEDGESLFFNSSSIQKLNYFYFKLAIEYLENLEL